MREPIAWRHLGLCAYDHGLRVQEAHWEARCGGEQPDVCLALEHPPTVTFGRRAGLADLRVPADALAERGIACVATERGGQATYHGPGQIVLYPVVDLRARDLTVGRFIWMLEEIIIETARAVGVTAARNPRGRGVWTSRGKLGAVGIRVRRNVTTHGLALNVNPDLTPFSLIVPCGMPDAPVTSLAREGARETVVAAVLPVLRASCERVFDAGRPATAVEVRP